MSNASQSNPPGQREIGLGLIGSMSIWHWVIVLVIVVLLFGRGKISSLMGDFAKGIKSFKRGLADDDVPAQPSLAERPAGDKVATGSREEQRNAG